MAFGQQYVACAAMLARSIKRTQSFVTNISLVIDDKSILTEEEQELFDKVIVLPWREEVWQARSELWYYSPYEQTMFVESDIVLTNDISDWWRQLDNEELAVTNYVRDFTNQIYTGGQYRRFFLENNLPNVYSGIMFWKKTKMVDDIFELWKED